MAAAAALVLLGSCAAPEARRGEVVAHRGFSAAAPENTLAAFRAAIAAGADRVEMDVLLSADGVPVILHDAKLDRTTDGKGPVSKMTLEELRKLDAGRRFAPAFAGERIPTLDEVLDLCRGKIAVNVEIKGEAVRPDDSPPPDGIEAKVVAAILRCGMEGTAVVSSFEPRALARIRVLAPGLRTQSLYAKKLHEGMSPAEVCGAVGSRDINCSAKEITPEWVAAAHRAGLGINVYTVNKPEEMRRISSLGVDGIITDRPDALLEVLGRRRPAGEPGREAEK
jgi:glycerophosphoryl diester phosphodiesterase